MVQWHYYGRLYITILSNYVLHCFWLVLAVVCTRYDNFCLLKFFLCPCMAINVSVQYDGGLLPGTSSMLLANCYYMNTREPV